MEVQSILKQIGGEPLPTCSLDKADKGCVAFCRSKEKVSEVQRIDGLYVVGDLDVMSCLPEGVIGVELQLPEWSFWKYHNWYWGQFKSKLSNGFGAVYCGSRVEVDRGALLGVSGMKLMRSHTGEQIRVQHVGKLIVGNDVGIGPGAIIHRGVLSDTVIGDFVEIGSLSNVGHNVKIGGRSIITTGVQLGGSSSIGKRCFVGMGAVVLEGVSICDDVKIGAGSVVTKDIYKPGVWFGSPAKFIKEWNGGW